MATLIAKGTWVHESQFLKLGLGIGADLQCTGSFVLAASREDFLNCNLYPLLLVSMQFQFHCSHSLQVFMVVMACIIMIINTYEKILPQNQNLFTYKFIGVLKVKVKIDKYDCNPGPPIAIPLYTVLLTLGTSCMCRYLLSV